jgi:hypothetical protein
MNKLKGILRARVPLVSVMCAFFAGLIVVGINIFNFSFIYANPDWIKTEGTVVGSRGEITGLSRGGIQSKSWLYKPVVEYFVNGKTYETEGRVFEESLPRVGATRQVAYNPRDPSRSKVIVDNWQMLNQLVPTIIATPVIIWALYQFTHRRTVASLEKEKRTV